jgi:hypothetical protein
MLARVQEGQVRWSRVLLRLLQGAYGSLTPRFSRLGTTQYAVYIKNRSLLKLVQHIEAIRNQPARVGIKRQGIDRWQAQASG